MDGWMDRKISMCIYIYYIRFYRNGFPAFQVLMQAFSPVTPSGVKGSLPIPTAWPVQTKSDTMKGMELSYVITRVPQFLTISREMK